MDNYPTIRNIRSTDTGLSGGSFIDADLTYHGITVSITAGWEDHNESWVPYGNGPDMWMEDPQAFGNDEDAMSEIVDAIMQIKANANDYWTPNCQPHGVR